MGLRVIAGTLRGKKLDTVRGNLVRPTTDRVRESIFNILSAHIPGSRVLDLFSGTGALGIEALSRGAESALFIEQHRSSLSTIDKNIKACKLEEKTKVITWNISRNLNCLKAYEAHFNMVFMDPPYNRNLVVPTLCFLEDSNALENNAIITVEHDPQEIIKQEFKYLSISDQRKYGSTMVSFLNYQFQF